VSGHAKDRRLSRWAPDQVRGDEIGCGVARSRPETGHPFRQHGRSSQTDVLREVGAQDLIELVQLVVAQAHEQESEDRVARILDAA